jgi:polygalacturonase
MKFRTQASRRRSSLSRACAPVCARICLLEPLDARRLLSSTPQPAVPLPQIPSNVFFITDYGATTSSANNAADIQAAITAATTAGGGTVIVPTGTFLSGPINLASNINLEVDGELQMLAKGTWPSANDNFITIPNGDENVEISGHGVVDGQGAGWWPAGGTRPKEIAMSDVTTVLITDLTLQNPPMQHIVVQNHCNDITIDAINVHTASTSPNTDGMDLSGHHEIVENCTISDGDDNVAIGASSVASATPETDDITVINNSFGFGHGVSIGSHTSGGVKNILVTDDTFVDTRYGIRLKSDNTSGGMSQNLTYSHLTMHGVETAIAVSSWYTDGGINNPDPPSSAPDDPKTATTAIWKDISFSYIDAVRASSSGGTIFGRPEAYVDTVTFNHVDISSRIGFQIAYATDVTITASCVFATRISLPLSIFDVTDLLTGMKHYEFTGAS